MRIFFYLILPMILLSATTTAQFPNARMNRVIIEGDLPSGFNPEMKQLYTFVSDVITSKDYDLDTVTGNLAEGKIKWNIPTNKPTTIKGPFIADYKFYGVISESGDSISIRHVNNKLRFTGKGAANWELTFRLREVLDSLENLPERRTLSSHKHPPTSLEDFFKWNQYLNKRISLILSIMEVYRPEITSLAYNEIKRLFLLEEEKRRLWKFNFIRLGNTAVNKYGLTNKDLCNIYDSVMINPSSQWLMKTPYNQVDLYYHWYIMKLNVYRKYHKFFKTSPDDQMPCSSQEEYYFAIYNDIKKNFQGLMKERMMAFTFWDKDGLLGEVGFNSRIDSLLQDYYNTSQYDAYKEAVKKAEVKYRKRSGSRYIPSFSLTDKDGNKFSNYQLNNKVALIDFWFTGCTGCVQMAPALKNIEEKFSKDTNVVFVSISIDKNFSQWTKSIEEGEYVSGKGIHLYTEGKGSTHDLIKGLTIEGYPSLLLINPQGRIVPYDVNQMDPRKDQGKGMTTLINQLLSDMKDGPYILHEGKDSIISWSFLNNQADKKILSAEKTTSISTINYLNQTYNIPLQQSVVLQPSVYAQPEKLLALSDIEGNLPVLTALLRGNGVIDDQQNWTFGNGHLVFAGDMFDRGTQVTECLWLIYALEEKAKAAGGYIHFILGNHEIMNLQGEHKYTQKKYLDNAIAAKQTLKDMYSSKSELGRWLRSKNIMEKIGNIIFVHGGVSAAVTRLNYSVEKINNIARPYYDINYVGKTEDTLLIVKGVGPTWYRGYYYKDHTEQQLDSTLKFYKADHIITGHTIISDTISSLFNGKLFNTDTHHAAGNSEALLINGKRFYRTNQEGKLTLIYDANKNNNFVKQ
ncbi:redoxin family protein [Pseudoflavitalea sp. G-6-1-2]|uniref:metallophosphoesterase n=1 Tax=Pseudoflavitalea sp. G-6-1-2 TaxID=2728841 RepID=UPI00146E854A|nr:metallophosphoesterase [Pseudoflavitalea sp. G-6-1-2]NML22970.1 redoxin family protein [Pseudoflavitalea sp. G-6-1-2]